MFNTYVHDPLVSPDHIRLLELLPGEVSTPISALVHQIHLPLDDGGSLVTAAAPVVYTALSYTWGPDIKSDEVPIWLDGQSFPVRPNLFAALRALRQTGTPVALWVDAVCINQADVYERNHQVARMGRIYRAARTVKVWLSAESEERGRDLKAAMEHLRSQEGKDLPRDTGDPRTRGVLPVQTIQALLEHEYWSRAWIVQEVVLAAELIIHYGAKVTVRWDELVQIYELLQQQLSTSPATRLIDRRTAIVRKQTPLLGQTLESLIQMHHSAKCTERRDRIYAFLPLASDCAFGRGLQPDYTVPRLALLAQVLEFCRPVDPVGFASTLFTALANDGNDAAWGDAARHWIEASQTSDTLTTVSDDATTSGFEKVRVTHLVAASSTSRDWVRVYAFPAVLDSQAIDRDTRSSRGEVEEMICNRVLAEESLQYQDRVCKLGDSRLGILLRKDHYAVFSTCRTSAAESPCTALGLHAKADSCTFAHCGLLRSG